RRAVLARGAPLHGLRVDVARGEPLGDELADRRRVLLAARARAADALHHVLLLRDDRAGEPAHVLDGQARDLGDRLDGVAGPQPRLDLARGEVALALRAQVLEVRAVPPHGRAQRLGDRQRELRAA